MPSIRKPRPPPQSSNHPITSRFRGIPSNGNAAALGIKTAAPHQPRGHFASAVPRRRRKRDRVPSGTGGGGRKHGSGMNSGRGGGSATERLAGKRGGDLLQRRRAAAEGGEKRELGIREEPPKMATVRAKGNMEAPFFSSPLSLFVVVVVVEAFSLRLSPPR
ncbi:hypothetical protein NL676_012104, partial [Syzygium grande]